MANASNGGFTPQELVAFRDRVANMEDGLTATGMVTIEQPDPTALAQTAVGGNSVGGGYWKLKLGAGVVMNTETYDNSKSTGLNNLSVFVPVNQPLTAVLPCSAGIDAFLNDQFQKQLDLQLSQVASNINSAILREITNKGSIVIRQSTPFDSSSLSTALATLTSIGTAPNGIDRSAGIAPNDLYAATNSLGGRQTMDEKNVTRAFRDAYFGKVATFSTMASDSVISLDVAGALSGATETIDLTAGSANNFVPDPIDEDSAGNPHPKDNRTQTITVSSTTGVKPGDCFSISGVYWRHNQTKQPTDILATFRVVSVVNATQMVITTPICTNQQTTASALSAQYASVYVSVQTANLTINWLNTARRAASYFLSKEAVVLACAAYRPDPSAGVAVATMMTPKYSIPVTMTKQYIQSLKTTNYDFSVKFGVSVLEERAVGVILSSQT